MDPLIVGVCSFAAGIGLSGLVFYICDLKKRVGTLEAAQAKHLPYRTADEIEDATAAILRIKEGKMTWEMNQKSTTGNSNW
jgi:hypothetical protein